LWNARGKPVIPKNVVSWKDHFVFAGTVVLELPPGQYTFEMQHGPEYVVRTGNFLLERNARDSKQVDLQRFADMKKEGWWSGETHIHRPLEDVKLLMLAEDLHVGPVITWWNTRNLWQDKTMPERTTVPFDVDRYYDVMAGEDERGGGALLFFGLGRPLAISDAAREHPSSVHFLLQAKQSQPDVHIDIEKPFWWDTPLWLATGKVDSIGIAHNHMWPGGVLENEAWGKARDLIRYPNPHGNGRWTQDIYYHALNCGLRIAPSAGSASGVLPNPVGYNRVYVHVDGDLSYRKWWEGLRAGRVVVTNGPLLRPRVNGELPGHVFRAAAGEQVTLQPALDLALRENVEYLQILKDGKTLHEVRLDEYAQAGGRLPAVTFDKSGWMMIRAVTNHPQTFRFAASGPFYVEIGEQPRISRESAQFFLDWVQQRAGQLTLDNPQQQAEVLEFVEQARKFWQEKVERANAE
jgi:hypothetical protein